MLIPGRKISFGRWKVDLSSFRVRFRKILCNKLLDKFVYSYVTTICSLHGSSIFLFWSFKELSALLCKKTGEKRATKCLFLVFVEKLSSPRNEHPVVRPFHRPLGNFFILQQCADNSCTWSSLRKFLHTLAYSCILLHLSVQANSSLFILRGLLYLLACWSMASFMNKASSCKVLADTARALFSPGYSCSFRLLLNSF